MKTRFLIGPVVPVLGYCGWAMLYGQASPYADAMTWSLLAWVTVSLVFWFWMTAREELSKEKALRQEFIEEFGHSPSDFVLYERDELIWRE